MDHSLLLEHIDIIRILRGKMRALVMPADIGNKWQVGDTIAMLPIKTDEAYNCYSECDKLPKLSITYIEYSGTGEDTITVASIDTIVN